MIAQWQQKGTFINYSSFNFKVFVMDLGDAQAASTDTLLILHGFPESSYSFHKVINGLLSKHKRLVLFDFLGFGLSDKPSQNYTYSIFEQADLALFVFNHLKITGGHLLAHDMGDTIATELVYRATANLLPAWFSKGFHSVTFTNGNMVIEEAKLRITQKILLTKLGGPLLSKLTSYALFKQQVNSASGSNQLNEAEIKILWQQILHKGGKPIFYKLMSYYKDRMRFQNARWLPALTKTNIPINICWGTADSVAPIAVAHHLKKRVCPKANLTEIAELGHFGQLENPSIWLNAVLSVF